MHTTALRQNRTSSQTVLTHLERSEKGEKEFKDFKRIQKIPRRAEYTETCGYPVPSGNRTPTEPLNSPFRRVTTCAHSRRSSRGVIHQLLLPVLPFRGEFKALWGRESTQPTHLIPHPTRNRWGFTPTHRRDCSAIPPLPYS